MLAFSGWFWLGVIALQPLCLLLLTLLVALWDNNSAGSA